jgi:SAM-dependent methyltransferase
LTAVARALAAALRSRAPALERILRALYALPGDLVDTVGGRRDPLVPPRRLRTVGRGDFHAVGQAVADAFVDLARVSPDASVLDVGCGVGRVARPLTCHLGARGRYCGFDVVPEAIEWCRAAITTRYPNFTFHVADVSNPRYRPRAHWGAASYRFPYPDGSFDAVLVSSVFTHMRAAEVDHYLDEIARVLRNSGRCLITCFLLTEEARAAIAAERTPFLFRHEVDGAWVVDPALPEAAIAYEEAALRELCARHGLSVPDAVEYGSWTGARRSRGYQDMLVAVKDPVVPAAPGP